VADERSRSRRLSQFAVLSRKDYVRDRALGLRVRRRLYNMDGVGAVCPQPRIDVRDHALRVRVRRRASTTSANPQFLSP
jgi:hypothetical protein